MKNITIYEKGTAKILTQDLVNKHHAVYKVNLDSAEIAKIVKVNNNLEVYLQSGEKVVIEDFFIGEKPKEFTIETSDGKHYLLEFLEFDANGTVTKIDYLGINDFHEYLVGEHAAVPVWAWVAGAAGIIGIAAAAGSSGGSSNHSGNGDKTAPKITHQILDNQKIKIAADEASKITIVDSTGKTIGSGQLNQAGSLDITLTRPLVDNEKITITAIDNAGNKTTETINVGDVTKPEVEVNIVDNNTVHIVSNEPGSKVIIKNEAGQTIGEGVIGSNGELNVDLNTTLTDGSKIIVDVIDTSGNQTEKVITVGDVTPPIIESNIKDATHIEVTSNESGQVKITDSNGNVIGTGTITGNNVVDDIQLTRPLADGETVTVTVTDAAGNPKALDITAGDVTAPTITSTVQDATHIEVSSNEAGQVKITDSNGNVIGTGTITGNNVVDDIQLTRPLADGEKVTVTVTDAAGNPKAIDITAGDVTNPQFESANVDNSGTQLTLTYSEALDSTNLPTPDSFVVTAGGQSVTVTGVSINGNNVILTLAPPITTGQSVQIAYTDPTTANDINAIQDVAGNDAASLPATTVTNDSTVPGTDTTPPIFVSATVDNTGTQLVLTYNKDLDSANLPLINSFAVTADGQIVAVTGVSVNGSTVVLTLGTAVTAGQAVEVGYTDPTAGNDVNAIQDAAGNDAASLPATPVSNDSTVPGGDTTAPTFVSAAVDTTGTSLTLTYSEALDGTHPPAVGDFTVTAGGQVVTVTGVTVVGSTVVLTLGTPVTAGQAVEVGYTDPTAGNDLNAIQDAAGNDAASLPATPVSNDSTVPGGDTTAPTFVSAAVDTTGTSLTLTYSEALDGTHPPAVGDFTVTAGGQVVTVTNVAVVGSTVVLTLGAPVTAGQAVEVGYTDPTAGNDLNAIQDAAGNDAATLPPTSVSNGSVIPGGDTTAPTFVNATVDPLGTTLTLNYSEALDPLNPPVAGDFAVTADGQVVAITNVLVVGSSVVLTLGAPVTAGQAVEVGYTDPTAGNDVNAIQDAAGNDAASLPATPVSNDSTVPGGDTTAPTFVSAAVDTTGTSLTLTYSEALDGTHPPAVGDFTVTAGGQVVTVTNVAVVGSTVVLTLGAPVTAGQAVEVGYTDPTAGNDLNAIQDAAGNDAASLPATPVNNDSTVPGGDTTAPTFVSAAVDTTGLLLTLTYNELLDATYPPVAGDFAVTAGGQVVTVTNVAVVGSTVVLTLGAPVTAGQSVTVGYTDPSVDNDVNAIQDIAGNDAATLTPTAVDNGSTVPAGDTTAPSFESAAVDSTGLLLTLTYNELLDATHPPVAGDFAVTAGGQVVTVTNVAVVGSTVVLTLGAPVTAGQSVTVGYTDPSVDNDVNAIQDIAGNDAATLTPTAVDNGSTVPAGDTTAPSFESAAVDSTGLLLTLTYNELLDATHPPVAGDFAVTAGGQVVTVTNVAVVGSTVVLTLGAPVTAGQSVTVGYTDPSVDNDVNAIQDIAGNDAATLTPTAVDNGSTVPAGDTTAPSFESAAVDSTGLLLTLTYNELLDATHPPVAGDFAVTAGGQVVTVTNVAVVGSTVVLTLGAPVTAGQSVTVGYTDPSVDNDVNAIQDIAGNDAATLTPTAVDNGSTVPAGDTTAPSFESAAVDSTGLLLTLTYNELLDATHPPVAGDFAVTAGGQVVTVTNVAVVGSTVVLTLGAPVTAGQSVTVGYTDPSVDNDVNAIQDIAGNDAATLTPTAVDNGSTVPAGDTTAPSFESAAVDSTGLLLTLTYNELLDATHPPVAGDFAVTAGGQVVTVTNVAVVGSTVVLTLGAPVTAGQSVTVGYTDPSVDNDVNAIQDIAGNDAATLTPTAVDNGSTVPAGDTTAPSFESAAVDSTGLLLTLTYNELLDATHPPVAGDFAVTAGGQVVTVTNVAVVGSTVVLTLGAPVTAGQSVTVGYTDPSVDNDVNAIQDIAGNDAATLTPTAVDNGSTVPAGDTTAPSFESAAVDSTGLLLTLTYNELLDATHPPVAGDFAVTAGGQVVTVTNVAVVGSTVVLTLGAPVTAGQSVTVGYTDPSVDNDVNAIQDIAGNDAATLTPTAVDNGSTVPAGDTTAPSFESAAVDSTGLLLTLTYNELLDATHPPVAGDFAVTAGGQVVTVTNVAVVGSTVVLTLGAPVTAGQSVTVGYTDPSVDNDVNAIQDIAGNDAATLTPTAVDNGSTVPAGDTTAPSFESAAVDSTGLLLTLTYNELLDATHPPVAGDFAVTAGGQVVTVTNVAVVGSTVVLTLGAPVTAGQSVTVGYTDPSVDNDVNAIQDIAGNDAATLAPTAVDNGSTVPAGDTTAPSFESAAVDSTGLLLTLTYNELLDATHPPVAGDFAVTAGGQVVTVTNVAVVGSTVVLTLGAPVTAGQSVTVGYTDPSVDNDVNAIQDIAGNDAATLAPTAVDNGSTVPAGDTTAPSFESAAVDSTGLLLTLTYNELLDATHPPVAGDFAVTAGGQVVTVTNVAVVGSTVVLTLGAPVTAGQAVQVGYTDPTAANDPNAIQDIAGNDAATLPPTSVSNGSIVLPPLNAVNDEFALNLGQEVRVNRTEVAGSDIAVVDILGNNATGLNFSIPQTPGSAGKGATGNISVTVSQQDLISVGEAVQIVIYQQTSNGPVEVARGTSQGGIVTVGGIGIIGVVNSNDSIKLDFTNLPEGNYTVAVQADDSTLTTLLKDVAITDLGGEGEILGASNAAAIEAAINAVLGPLGAPVLALVNTILIPVNTLGLPLSSVVNQLLNVLPISVVDYIVDAAVAPLLSNLLTIYEKTNISVTGTEEVFANYAVTGNVFADNGNGQDVIGGGSITEIDGAPVAQGSVTIQGEYGSLEINTLTGVFTYTVTAGESAVGKTEIFDYKLSNGATSDTAQIIINIAGTPADPGDLTPPDYVDQVVANDDLATVKNYQETVGDDVGVQGRASQLLGVNLLGLNVSLGNTVPFNFEVEENSTSSINVNVSGSFVNAALGGIVGTLLGTSGKVFNAVLERQYLDENGVAQKEYFIVQDAVKLTATGLLGAVFTYSGQINVDSLPPGVYTIALQENPTDAGLLQQILNLLDSTLSAQLFGGVELTMQAQTNKYLGSGSIEGNVISSVDGADEVNTTTFVTQVENEIGGPIVTLSGANTVVVGAYGTLYISPNGHYKYVSNGAPEDIGKVDTFTYTIRDFNGTQATAHLNIRIDGDNSGVVWDNANPQNDVTLPAPIVLDNSDHAVIGAVTNIHQTVTSTQGELKVASGLFGAGGNGTYTPTTFSIANTDSAHVVVKVNIPALSIGVAPQIILTIKDQNGVTVGTITQTPVLTVLGGTVTVDIPNLGPGTYTITSSASGNTGLAFNAAVTVDQNITHYNDIAPVTAAPITGNMLTDDTYNHAYAKFSIDTGNGQFTEVGYNGITIQGDYGSLFVKSDGSYVYTPKAGEIGRQEVFDYKLTVFGQDHIASLTVTIDAITTGDALRNTLISGELNDSFTGNGGSDVLVYHVLESASATGGNGTDHWTDFHAGNVNTDTNADVIDISDLLIGFNSANITTDLTASANYLKNYLGVRVDGNNVTLTLDRDGAGTTYTGKTDLLQLDNLAQSGAAFNGKTEDDILKLLLQNHQLVL
ncbi:BapA/Bap/LapF family large adhesin [Acinetobacter bereziniae]|uniref:BapA/Bap/LapF family large adhesin n=17 Tax=Acinetobacter TaxID=469 RepID=UPI00224CE332|nr:BapA/Bap/LapF family large adhesin [Acinetobacter bereziniae]